MQTFLVQHLEKVKKAISLIEKRLNVKISYSGKKITVKGEELDEFLVQEMIRAVDFGFDAEDTLMLKNPNFILQFINIKDYTKKKNLKEVRARIIGARGRAKGTIQELTGSVIVVHESQVGIIVDSAHLDSAIQAITSLIRGAKHANVFAYLEKQNVNKKKFDDEDLGLKQ